MIALCFLPLFSFQALEPDPSTQASNCEIQASQKLHGGLDA